MIQTPGISRLVGCRPMGPVGWLTGAAGAAIGTTVGITGPWVERQLAGDQAAWSATIVGRLAELGPDLPGLVEA